MFESRKLKTEVEVLKQECADLKGQVELLGREMSRLIQSQQAEGKTVVSVPSEEGEFWLKSKS